MASGAEKHREHAWRGHFEWGAEDSVLALPFNGISPPEEEYSTRKLVEDTEFASRVPFEEGIRVTVDWLKIL